VPLDTSELWHRSASEEDCARWLLRPLIGELRSVPSAERRRTTDVATSARLEDALGELDAPREDFQAEDERADHADLSE
jgi:hypothetical protein